MDMSLDDIIRLKKKRRHRKRKPAKTDPAGPPQKTPLTTRGNMKGRSRNPKSGVFRGGAARAFLGRRPLGTNALKVPKTQRAVKSPFPRQQRRHPPARQTDARQATFLHRRGLKVRALVRKPNPGGPLPVGSRPWRSWTNNTGQLTVSIDNPAAMTQAEPPRAWTLHPPAPRVSREERPRGVPLRFQIYRVGKAVRPKQTSLSLNERFGILKARRAPTGKGGRLVLVD
ncbi:UAP56-interacting factor-like isoform X2 [Stigmatopora nigra]